MVDHERKTADGYTTWTQDLPGAGDDLTTADSVSLYIEAPDGTTPVAGASVTAVDSDTVEYQFGESELAQTGIHKAEFHVDYSGTGPVEVLPKNDYYTVQVDGGLT
jgi:hypothetical protein